MIHTGFIHSFMVCVYIFGGLNVNHSISRPVCVTILETRKKYREHNHSFNVCVYDHFLVFCLVLLCLSLQMNIIIIFLIFIIIDNGISWWWWWWWGWKWYLKKSSNTQTQIELVEMFFFSFIFDDWPGTHKCYGIFFLFLSFLNHNTITNLFF